MSVQPVHEILWRGRSQPPQENLLRCNLALLLEKIYLLISHGLPLKTLPVLELDEWIQLRLMSLRKWKNYLSASCLFVSHGLRTSSQQHEISINPSYSSLNRCDLQPPRTLEPVLEWWCHLCLLQTHTESMNVHFSLPWKITHFNHLVTHDEVFAKADSKVKQIKSEQSASEE